MIGPDFVYRFSHFSHATIIAHSKQKKRTKNAVKKYVKTTVKSMQKRHKKVQ